MSRDADVVFQLVTSKYKIADRNRRAKYRFLTNDPKRRGSEPLEKSEDNDYVKQVDLSLPGTPVSSRYISYLQRNRKSIETDSEDEDNDREVQIKNNTLGFLDESFRKFTENMKSLQKSITFEPPENPKETVEQFKKTVKTKTGTIQEFTTYKTTIETGPSEIVFSSKTLLYTESKPANEIVDRSVPSPKSIEKKLHDLEKQILRDADRDADSEHESDSDEKSKSNVQAKFEVVPKPADISIKKIETKNEDNSETTESAKKAVQNYFDESSQRNSYKRDFSEVVETFEPKPKPVQKEAGIDLLIPGVPVSSKSLFGKKKKKVTSVTLPPQNFPNVKFETEEEKGKENGVVKEKNGAVALGNGIKITEYKKEEKDEVNEKLKQKIDENTEIMKVPNVVLNTEDKKDVVEVNETKEKENDKIEEKGKQKENNQVEEKEKDIKKVEETDSQEKVEEKEKQEKMEEKENQEKVEENLNEPKEIKEKNEMEIVVEKENVKELKSILKSKRTRSESERSDISGSESPQINPNRRIARRSSVDEMEQYFIESGRRSSYQNEIVNQVQQLKNKIFGRQKSQDLSVPGTTVSSKYLQNNEEYIDNEPMSDRERKNSQVFEEALDNYDMYGDSFQFKPKKSQTIAPQNVEVTANANNTSPSSKEKVIRFRYDSLTATTIEEESLDHAGEVSHAPDENSESHKRRRSKSESDKSDKTSLTGPDSPQILPKVATRKLSRRSSVDEMEQFFIESGRRSSYQKEISTQVLQLQEKMFGKQNNEDLSVPGTTVSSKYIVNKVSSDNASNEKRNKLDEAIDDMVLFGEGCFKIKSKPKINREIRNGSAMKGKDEKEEAINMKITIAAKSIEELNEKSLKKANIDLMKPGVPISSSFVQTLLNENENVNESSNKSNKTETKAHSKDLIDDDIKNIVDGVLEQHNKPNGNLEKSDENFKGNEKLFAEALINEVIEELNEKIDMKNTKDGKEFYELKSPKILLSAMQSSEKTKVQQYFDETDGKNTFQRSFSEVQEFNESQNHDKIKLKVDQYFEECKGNSVIDFTEDSLKSDKDDRSLRSRTSSIASDISNLSNSDVVHPPRKYGKKKMTVDKYFATSLYKAAEQPQKQKAKEPIQDDVD